MFFAAVDYLSKVYKTVLESFFWTLYWLKPPFGQLRSCQCEF